MVAKIKGVDVAGQLTKDGRCPYCGGAIIVRDKGYTAIKNHRCVLEIDTGEQVIKCKCGQFVERPKVEV